MRRFLLITSVASIMLGLTACEGDHWGAEKKEKLTGERVSIVMPPYQSALSVKNNLPTDATATHTNTNWLVSIADSTKVGGNLKLTAADNKKFAVKIHGNSLFGFISTPIVHAGNIYSIDAHGTITAFTLPTGKKLWQSKELYKTQNNSFLNGGIMLDDGIIYATAGLNDVVALDAKTGQSKWHVVLRSPSRAVPVLANGLLIVQSLDNITYALDAQNGNTLWAHIGMNSEAQALVPVMPTAQSDGVIVQHSSGEVYKLSLQDGEEIWQINSAPQAVNALAEQGISRTALMPLLKHNKVYIVSPMGNLLCLNASDGTLIWQQDLHIDGSIWLTDHYIYAITDAKQLISIQQQDGALRWRADIATHLQDKKKKPIPFILAAPLVAEGQVLVNTSAGQQLRFDMQSGELKDKVQIATQVTLPPVIAGGNMYTLSNSGKMHSTFK